MADRGAAGDGRRADLLSIPFLDPRARRHVRRAERWRSRAWTAARVADRAAEVAAGLIAAGVQPGDRVALWLADGPLWQAGFFGALRAGAVAVPLDAALEPERARTLAIELDVAAWVTEREMPPLELDAPRLELAWNGAGGAAAGPIPSLPPDDPERTAEIVLTSGTSGVPRAVPVTHANLRAVLDALAAAIDEHRRALRWLPRPTIAAALPLSHLYGQLMGVFVPAQLDAHVVFVPPMAAPDLARRLAEERAWVLAAVPRTLALLGRWLEAEGEALWGPEGMARRLEATRGRPWPRRWLTFARLRMRLGPRLIAVVSGGASLDPRVEALWRALGVVVLQGYGLTETAPLVALDHPLDPHPGTLGRPLPGVEVRLAADGEILVRGPNVVEARLGGPATDAEGWLHTGDLGRLDDDGRLSFIGRKGDRIVTAAGVNVDLEPVAQRLRSQPGVLEAVALERPWGEPGSVAAVLVLRPGTDGDAAVREANRELPDAARVRAWRPWPEPDLPRTRTGKPRRAEIAAWLEGRTPSETAAARDEEDDPSFGSLARLVAPIAGMPAARLRPDDRLGDLLGSLDRVELATRLEAAWGEAREADVFDPERTLGEVARDLGRPSGSGPQPAAAAAESFEEGAPAAGRPTAIAPVPEARWRHDPAVHAARRVFQEAFLGPLWRSCIAMDVAGLEHLEDLAPPFLIAPNHLSVLDPGAVLFALPPRLRGRFAATAMWEHFARRPWLGPPQHALAVFGLNLVPLVQIGDWRPTLRIAGRVADRGGCPLIYPEGERSLDGRLLPLRPGIAVMARELHLPILPVGEAGLLAVMPKGAQWPRRIWLRRAPVAVRFGAPFPAPGPADDLEALVAALAARLDGLREAAGVAAGRF